MEQVTDSALPAYKKGIVYRLACNGKAKGKPTSIVGEERHETWLVSIALRPRVRRTGATPGTVIEGLIGRPHPLPRHATGLPLVGAPNRSLVEDRLK